MKINRNELCPCKSGQKYKNCCGTKNNDTLGGNKFIRLIIGFSIGFFLILTLWSIVDYYSTEHPEMEAYKCDNPSCNQIHYRQVSKTD